MSRPIPQAAINAAAKSLTEITPNLYQDPHNPTVYFGGLAERALEAALPHVLAQILAEIRAAMDDPALADLARKHEGYYSGQRKGLFHAFRIVEGERK